MSQTYIYSTYVVYQPTCLYMDLLYVMCDSCILNLIMNLCKWHGEQKNKETKPKRAMQQSRTKLDGSVTNFSYPTGNLILLNYNTFQMGIHWPFLGRVSHTFSCNFSLAIVKLLPKYFSLAISPHWLPLANRLLCLCLSLSLSVLLFDCGKPPTSLSDWHSPTISHLIDTPLIAHFQFEFWLTFWLKTSLSLSPSLE